ncbi:hypothetical protein BSKO_12490 [Bryopsis sp. KO-2023]|nr:hypothetical protein BSKO_12490 [Bryopsis sp. KO-2023]
MRSASLSAVSAAILLISVTAQEEQDCDSGPPPPGDLGAFIWVRSGFEPGGNADDQAARDRLGADFLCQKSIDRLWTTSSAVVPIPSVDFGTACRVVVEDMEGSLERLGLCFNDAEFSDVVVETEDGREFYCHKVVLAAASAVFAAMFKNSQSDSSGQSFREAKEGKVTLLGVANRGLQGRFAKYIHDNIATIKDTEGFLELSVAAIQHLLASSPTNFEFCLALARWLDHDLESRRGIAGSLLSELDLFSLEVDELKKFGALKAIEGSESAQRDIQQQLVEEVDAARGGEVTVLMRVSKAMGTLHQEDTKVEGKEA